MAQIRIASLGNRVVVLINYVVEVVRHLIHHIVEHLVVKGSVVHILRQGDGGQVAHRNFVGSGVLHDLGAEVRRTNYP